MTFIAFGLGLGMVGLLGAYWQSLAADALILLIFGISLLAMMALGGPDQFKYWIFIQNAVLVAEQNSLLTVRADRVITLVAGQLQR